MLVQDVRAIEIILMHVTYAGLNITVQKGGGGSNRLPALVTKQQAVEFPLVLTSLLYPDQQ